jgi:hypothetical protein
LGKIFLGCVLIAGAGSVLLIFAQRLKNSFGLFADFTRLLVIAICGAIGLLGGRLIRWAFEERSPSQTDMNSASGTHRRTIRRKR